MIKRVKCNTLKDDCCTRNNKAWSLLLSATLVSALAFSMFAPTQDVYASEAHDAGTYFNADHAASLSGEQADFTVADISDITFTGNVVAPDIVATNSTSYVRLGAADYDIEYRNNLNHIVSSSALKEAGTYTAVIVGRGDYSSSCVVEKSFRIVRAPFIVEAVEPRYYSGDVLLPDIIVKSFATQETLEEKRHYTVSFMRDGSVVPADEVKDAGTYTIVVQGLGAYSGFINSVYLIEKAQYSVESTAAATHTGYDLPPSVIVKRGDTILMLGRDYVVSYRTTSGTAIQASSLIDAGSYQVVVVGLDQANYRNGGVEIVKEYLITKATLAINGVENVAYTGKPIVPTVTIMNGNAVVGASDYALAYYNSSNKEVASIVEAGEYTVAVAMNDEGNFDNPNITKSFTVEKAVTTGGGIAGSGNQPSGSSGGGTRAGFAAETATRADRTPVHNTENPQVSAAFIESDLASEAHSKATDMASWGDLAAGAVSEDKTAVTPGRLLEAMQNSPWLSLSIFAGAAALFLLGGVLVSRKRAQVMQAEIEDF